MLYVLKNSGNLKNRSGWLRSRIYAKILEACEIARFSEEKRIQYNKDMIDERKREGELQAAKRIGWEEGREEGSRQARMELAKKLLAKGMTFNEVSEVTSLSEEELAEF